MDGLSVNLSMLQKLENNFYNFCLYYFDDTEEGQDNFFRLPALNININGACKKAINFYRRLVRKFGGQGLFFLKITKPRYIHQYGCFPKMRNSISRLFETVIGAFLQLQNNFSIKAVFSFICVFIATLFKMEFRNSQSSTARICGGDSSMQNSSPSSVRECGSTFKNAILVAIVVMSPFITNNCQRRRIFVDHFT